MTEERRKKLRSIKTFKQLLDYLRDELDWPIDDVEDDDELTFDWSDDLGLKDSEKVGIKAIKQLRPLETGQPWGIFFVDFEKKRLPIVILRRILNALVVRKRAGGDRAGRAAWKLHDLLFISSYGEEGDRQLTFAHFSEPSSELDDTKATLRVLGWDDDDTNLHLDHVSDVLHAKLRWPQGAAPIANWRKTWAEAFELRHRQVIDTAEDLALRLADLAKRIRNRMLEVLPRESEKGELRKLMQGFKTALIHDLDNKHFADMYAQTIVYGLFSAAVSRTVPGAGTAVQQGNVIDMVPITNPFLREMLQGFLKAGGRKHKLDFDELGIQEVVDLLNDPKTKMEAVLRDFGNRTRGEDPVIHFYERFLAAYDKKLKVQRGVFYTPQPVVSYIVRSVHELLQTEFGLADGLADTATWADMLARHPDMKLPMLTDDVGEQYPLDANEPFVQVLDPATGTATFLVEVVDVIHKTMRAKWKRKGSTEAQQTAAWNDYVPKHLLPRIHGFELMMAPYAIAHMKVGLKLSETGYNFGTDERARIYLTNALEPWKKQLALPDFEALAHEAAAVNHVKRNGHFTVLLGNPPYASISSNLTPELRRIVDPYRKVDGVKIQERSMLQFEKNIQDDYVKFFAFAQACLRESGQGVCVIITNHSYIDAPTLRGLRWNLLSQFSRRWFLDLHGNTNKSEEPPDGMLNENVFDIKQGVAIAGLLNGPGAGSAGFGIAELWGGRSDKYEFLENRTLLSTPFSEIEPQPPYFYFVPPNTGLGEGYWNTWPSVADIFTKRSTGTESGFDSLLIAFTRTEVESNIHRFADISISTDELAQEFDFEDGHASELFSRRREMADASTEEFKPLQLRPYDYRYAFLRKELLKTNSFNVMLDLGPDTPGLVTTRQTKESFAAFAVNAFCGHKVTSSYDRSYVFPLFSVDHASLMPARICCLRPGTMRYFRLLDCNSNEADLAIDVFHYVIAVMNARAYGALFRSQLKRDFPRLPLIENVKLFRTLVNLGRELVGLHLLESPKLETLITRYEGPRNPEVEKPTWSSDTVWIDKAQAIGFQGVLENVWNFKIGGYQVCERWLKDRKSRTLSSDDITYYQKIIVALSETIRVIGEIDAVVENHGGWPAAFAKRNLGQESESGLTADESPAKSTQAPVRTPKATRGRNAGALSDLFAALPAEANEQPVVVGRVADIDAFDRDELFARIRQIVGDGHARTRDEAIVELARSFGYQRTGKNIRETLDNALRTAVRRGILANDCEGLRLRYRSIEQFEADDRDGLKDQFLAALEGRTWVERSEATVALARWLGFARTGAKIEEIAASLINGLLRENRLQADGTRIRRFG